MLDQVENRDGASRHSTRRYETLVNSVDGVVWESDATTLELTFMSEQAERLLGFSVDRCLKEDSFWQNHVHAQDRAILANFLEELAKREPGKNFEYRLQGLSGCVWKPVDKSKPLVAEYRFVAAESRILWVRNVASVVEEEGKRLVRGVLWDISEQKLAAQQLELLHQQLLQVSRQAGMAEVATEVLHNVGNVLNSINVASSFIRERLQRSELRTMARVATLLTEHSEDLPRFLTEDPKGKLVPRLFIELSHELNRERDELVRESDTLVNNIEHVKSIVRMQQNYAKVTGTEEQVALVQLVDEALEIAADPLRNGAVEIVREYDTVPKITIDKHKVLQIIVNLVRNANSAMEDPTVSTKRLTLKVFNDGATATVVVKDTGMGIHPDHITRIFGHGFTTKKDGHGFGLHSGALTAKEMGGRLVAHSDGVGQGATFTLELPYSRTSSPAQL
jgi:signal transduction histidine kinase